MLLVGHHSSPLTSARPPAGLEGTQNAPLCTLQCPQIRPSSPLRRYEPLAASFLNSFSCEELLHSLIKAAKLRSVSSVSVRSGFSVRSARGDRKRNEDDARVARRQHRTIREQSVQSSALKARLQQKAVARPSARVVNSKFTRLLCVPAPPGVF